MSGDFCFQGRPPLERLKNLSVTCLVLDSIFVLLYGLAALSSSGSTLKTACYEAHGYTWHNVVTLTLTVSAFVAASGAVVHASVSCGASINEKLLDNISRFAHGLVVWTFVAAILEAIAYRQEPLECTDSWDTSSQQQDTGGTASAEDGSNIIWQVAYTLLWLGWVISAVASSVLARRVSALLPELVAASSSGTTPAAPSFPGQQGVSMTPQTVGMPVQFPPGMAGVQGVPAFGSTMGGPVGPCGPAGAVAGAPCGPAAAGGAAAQGNATWQGGMVAAGGAVVAQGMPVAGSTPDPEKGGGGGGAAGGGKSV